MAVQTHGGILPLEAVQWTSSDAEGLSVYSVCVPIFTPDIGAGICEKLSIDFDEGKDVTAQTMQHCP